MSRTDNDDVTRVSLFMPNLGGGGAERVMLLLAGGLVERGFETTVVVGKAEGAYSSKVPQGVRVVELGNPHTSRCILPLAKYLRNEKPDVLISALDHANLAALLARRLSRTPTRVIPTVHNSHSETKRHSSGIRNWALHRMIRRCYRWADAIVTVSHGTADDIVQHSGVPRELVRVIYNPVISDSIRESSLEPVDHPWFGPDQQKVVVAIGSLSAPKDFPTLLKAFALLRKNHCDVKLLILGEGEGRNNLEKMVRELELTDVVELPGFVKNPFAYLARSSLLVMSSAWEALPTVLIEALALGVPIVSTDCKNGPSEILEGGKYGRLVPIKNPAALAEAMGKTLSEPRGVIPPEAIAPYTIDAAVDNYVSLLEEMG